MILFSVHQFGFCRFSVCGFWFSIFMSGFMFLALAFCIHYLYCAPSTSVFVQFSLTSTNLLLRHMCVRVQLINLHVLTSKYNLENLDCNAKPFLRRSICKSSSSSSLSPPRPIPSLSSSTQNSSKNVYEQ